MSALAEKARELAKRCSYHTGRMIDVPQEFLLSLADALGDAERRAEEANDAWSDIVDELTKHQPNHDGSVMEMLRDLGKARDNLADETELLRDDIGNLRVTLRSLRAHLPALKALDEVLADCSDIHEADEYTGRCFASCVACAAANTRPALAEVVRVLQGE